MFKSILRDRLLVFYVLLAFLIKLFSLQPLWVERYYTYGFYPFISKLLRLLFGWIPFSVGDVAYVVAGIYLVVKLVKFIRLLVQRRAKTYLDGRLLRKVLKLGLGVYLVFNISWGLNYDRSGIAAQLNLDVKKYSMQDLYTLTQVLQQRLNNCALGIDSVRRLELNKDKVLFTQALDDYRKIKTKYPFLAYPHPSVKASLYGTAGKYFGYTGYYNPFTAEAQLKTSVPVFWKPFTINHEIAHQLGYAKENEASFVSYLVGKESDNMDVRYSIYYEMFFDAFSQLMHNKNIVQGIQLYKGLHIKVLYDKQEELRYHRSTMNVISPFMTGAYDKYLKMNNQPKGNATYNEVIAWLIAYMRRYGAENI